MYTALLAVVGLAAILLLFFFVRRAVFVSIRQDELAIVLRRGRVTGRVLGPGQYWLRPVTDTIERYPRRELTYMTVRSETYERVQAGELQEVARSTNYIGVPLTVTTEDGARGDILYTLRFRIDSDRLSVTHEKLGRAGIERVVTQESRHVVRATMRENDYSAIKLLQSESKSVEAAVTERLAGRLEVYGLDLTHFGFREPDLAEAGDLLNREMIMNKEKDIELEETRKALEIETAKSELHAETERRSSEHTVSEADAFAEARKREMAADAYEIRQQAEAKEEAERREIETEALRINELADARRKAAEGEAKGNQAVAESLTKSLIDYRSQQAEWEVQQSAAGRWDGKLPILSGQNPFTFASLTDAITAMIDREPSRTGKEGADQEEVI